MKKFYQAKLLSTKAASNENEKKTIETYNAALIGAAIAVNEKGMNLSVEDIEDAGATAGLKAIRGVDVDSTYRAYGGRCGRTEAIKTSERISRDRRNKRNFDSITVAYTEDEYTGCRVDEDNDGAFGLISDEWADKNIIAAEEDEERRIRTEKEYRVVGMLPKNDRIMVRMTMDGKTVIEIAEALGCTEQAVYSRRIALRNRFIKLLKKENITIPLRS